MQSRRSLTAFLTAFLLLGIPVAVAEPPCTEVANGLDEMNNRSLLPQAEFPPAGKKKVVLHGVRFGGDGAAILPDAAPALNEAAALVAHAPAIVVVAGEPADTVGSSVYRSILARRRAKALRGFLIDRGVPAPRITIQKPDQPRPAVDQRLGKRLPACPTELYVE